MSPTIIQLGVGGVPTFHVRLLLQLFHSLTTVYCEVNRNCLLWGLCSSLAHLIIQWLYWFLLTESDFDVSEIMSNKKIYLCWEILLRAPTFTQRLFCPQFHKYLVNRTPATVFHLRTIVRPLVLPIWHWITYVLSAHAGPVTPYVRGSHLKQSLVSQLVTQKQKMKEIKKNFHFLHFNNRC